MINPCENVNGHRNETTCVYALTNIHPMENHPFKVKDDEDMAAHIRRSFHFCVRLRFHKGLSSLFFLISFNFRLGFRSRFSREHFLFLLHLDAELFF